MDIVAPGSDPPTCELYAKFCPIDWPWRVLLTDAYSLLRHTHTHTSHGKTYELVDDWLRIDRGINLKYIYTLVELRKCYGCKL